jgi:hypothetical protein
MQKVAITAAIVIMSLVGFTCALAQTQDIGLGRMERSEFIALKALIQGRAAKTTPTISTLPIEVERYGMLTLSHAEFQTLRDKTTGQADTVDNYQIKTFPVQIVDIGTGGMPRDEFMALKNMVSEGVFFQNP